MKRFFSFMILLSLLAALTGCALQKPNLQDPPIPPDSVTTSTDPGNTPQSPEDPQPEPEDLNPQPDPLPDPEPVLSVTDRTDATYLGGNAVTITVPAVELQNSTAAEVINRFFDTLAGKVKDYAEGDLSNSFGITYTVLAEYRLTYSSSDALSFLWTVETTASSPELPGSSTVTAATFDPATGGLLTFDGIFGSNVGTVRNMFAEKANSVIGDRISNYYYYESWDNLLTSAMDVSCFYLTEEGVYLFYSRDALGTYTEVLLSWDELSPYLSIHP